MQDKPKKKTGRPSKFNETVCEQVTKLARLGATDVDIARFFEVDVSTLTNWKKVHPEFFAALKEGREIADAEVGQRLFQRAMGYSHESEKIMQFQGTPIVVPYVQHYPPDTTACIFWLKNRRPDLWRDRVDHKFDEKDLEKMSDSELRAAVVALLQEDKTKG